MVAVEHQLRDFVLGEGGTHCLGGLDRSSRLCDDERNAHGLLHEINHLVVYVLHTSPCRTQLLVLVDEDVRELVLDRKSNRGGNKSSVQSEHVHAVRRNSGDLPMIDCHLTYLVVIGGANSNVLDVIHLL